MGRGGTSPFWLLAVGLGVAFVVTSGRAKALYNVLTSPVATGAPTVPATGPSPDEECIPGYTWDPLILECKWTGAGPPPPPGGKKSRCKPGKHWDDTLLMCVHD